MAVNLTPDWIGGRCHFSLIDVIVAAPSTENDNVPLNAFSRGRDGCTRMVLTKRYSEGNTVSTEDRGTTTQPGRIGQVAVGDPSLGMHAGDGQFITVPHSTACTMRYSIDGGQRYEKHRHMKVDHKYRTVSYIYNSKCPAATFEAWRLSTSYHHHFLPTAFTVMVPIDETLHYESLPWGKYGLDLLPPPLPAILFGIERDPGFGVHTGGGVFDTVPHQRPSPPQSPLTLRAPSNTAPRPKFFAGDHYPMTSCHFLATWLLNSILGQHARSAMAVRPEAATARCSSLLIDQLGRIYTVINLPPSIMIPNPLDPNIVDNKKIQDMLQPLYLQGQVPEAPFLFYRCPVRDPILGHFCLDNKVL
ncbi:hypothetical protein V8D89_015964 [Ganoderma adspersum]